MPLNGSHLSEKNVCVLTYITFGNPSVSEKFNVGD